MATRNAGISVPRLPLAAVASVAVLLATAVSCQISETPPVAGGFSGQKFTPHGIEVAAGGGSATWALFDRHTASGWTPPASAAPSEVAVHLGGSAEVAALKVFGPSPYRLSLVDSRGERLSGPHELAALPEGWTTLALKAPLALERLTLRFERVGEGTAAIPELELWGRAAALPLAWEPAASPSDEEPPRALAEVLSTAPESERLSREPASGLAGCVTFSFDVARHPGTYRRAWLRYHAKGVFRPLVLTRALNSGPVMSGFWVPPTSSEVGAFIHPVDTEHLQLGRNRVEFCLPGEARGTVELSRVQFVAEFDHGSNNIESIAIAPVDAIPTQSAMSLLRENGEAVAVSAGQELVVAFERWISPDRVHVSASPEVTWSLRCVDAEAKARALPASLVEGTAGLYAMEDAGRTRCAGLRLRPSADTSVTHLRVFGSGAGRRVDFPRIILASAREHFGQEAWVDGWARAPSHVSGGVRVSIDRRETDTTTGIFASLLQRTIEPGADWPITVTARFADGSTFTRQFVLELNAGTLPGASSRSPGLNDGLTVEERRARFGEVGQVAEAEVAPGESKRIELGTHVAVEVPSRAMRGRKRISLKQLDTTALPPLDPGLINVTAPARRGYEFQPHGETFDDALKVTLPYQPSLIPPGYVPEDIQTFYYDETLKRWEPLARAEVVRGREVVESLTDHFTTLINAIVVAPEHPQAASFDPTRLKGIKAATPAAGLQLIAPPEVNSRGDAAMSYPLELPPGRLGVQPSFALSYNSARGNGWLGVGWDVGASAIEVETRWGVPRYDAGLETETYLLDGAQLSPTTHRTQPRARSQGATQFRPRVEGSFQRIIRQGSDPSRYWWELTDKKGTRFFYGGTPESGREPSACLTDASGNVFRWALKEIRDTHGNRVQFDYDTVTWTAPGQVPGRDLYLSSAHYTLRVGESTAPYRVVFLREPACASEGQSGCRPDLIVSGRGGFKQVTSERLRRVEVYYRQTLVRAWQLTYDQGPFGKSRLRQLTQFGVGNQPFPGNVHSFDYFDEVTESAGVYRGFSSAESWNAGAEAPDTGLALPAGFYDSIGEADASALGGTRTRSAGGHLYLGVAFSDKWLSVGAKTGMRQDTSEGQVALVDIDGDGLSDRVFRGAGGGFFFNRNLSGPSGPPRFATQAQPVEELPALSRERSTLHLSVGPEAYVFPVQFHANLAFSSAEQDTYLSDVNADGLVDLVQGSTVHFNRLRPDGLPRFAAGDSSGTAVRLGASAVSAEALPATFEAPGFEAELDRHSPPVDTVRVWQAPYAGRIRISGEVKLVQAQRPGADGLRASIEREGSLLWSHQFAPNETRPQRPSVEVSVAAGERLFFRLHLLQNEWDDRVQWSPLIEYLNLAPAQDENRLPVHRFDAAADFALAGRANTGLRVPLTGTLRLTGQFAKLRATSDDVVLQLTVDGTPAFSRVLPAASPGSVTLDERLNVAAGKSVALRIHTDSPIDLTALAFQPVTGADGSTRHGPWLRYVAMRDENGRSLPVEDHQGKPLFDIQLTSDLVTYSLRAPESPAPAFVSPINQILRVLASVEAVSLRQRGTVTFTAKSQGRLLAKRQFTVSPGSSQAQAVDVQVAANEPVFFSFSVSGPELFNTIRTAVTSEQQVLPSMRYGVAQPESLAHGYRGWSYAGYNGAGERGAQPIVPDELDAPPPFSSSEPPTEETAPDMARRFTEEGMKAFPLMPMAGPRPCRPGGTEALECSPVQGAHWQGPHERVYVAATEMSTTRLGGPMPRLVSPGQVAGGSAVPRLSRSQQTALGAGAFPASLSQAQGESRGLLDFLDMNGDGFPDVVTPERIQYTSPQGLLAEAREVPQRELRLSTTRTSTQGIGGNIASAVASARGLFGSGAQKAASGSASTQQMQPVGFAVNVGASEGKATSEADLLDVNGDALPDRVWKGNGTLEVALNLGYRFAPREPWGQAVINEGTTQERNAGASLSFNSGNYGFGGGVNGSGSTSGTGRAQGGGCGGTLLDLNGDGLVDCAEQADSGLRVWFNRGHRFASAPVSWRGGYGGKGLSESQSTTLGGGVYFSYTASVFGVGLIINPGTDFSESISRPVSVLQDINGDGYPDHLASSNPHEIVVARNTTGRTDLLRHVKRPLGAEIWLDYERTGNTQDMPHSRWALSQIKVYDGQADSAELGQVTDYTLQRIRYVGGRYDRSEREFYGFARVEVDTLDTRGWNGSTSTSALPVYRRQELEFHNSSYHQRGLLASSRTLRGDGAVFARATYQYELREATTGRVLTAEQAARTESVFPALVQENHYKHEGDPNASIHTFTAQDYDGYGNVISLYDAGGPGSGDDYRAEIQYTGRSSSCGTHHIVGVADRITVRDVTGTLLRKREATVDCASGTGDVRQIRVQLDGTTVAQTDLDYDADGNLISVTAPPNHNGQRYQLRYAYDSEVQTHVVRIDDSFGYYSTAEYDLRFGAPRSETDINGNSVLTEYDAFGRVERVRGPYELERGLEYALRFTYRPDAVVPFATTAHMDVFRNAADPIETVTLVDGLGRALQTKKDATLHRGVNAAAQDGMIVSGRTHFDPWGRVVAQWYPTEEPKSTALNLAFTRPVDTSAPPTRTTYDVLDRTLEIVTPDAARTRMSYSLGPALSGSGLWALTTTIDAEDNRRDAWRDARENIRAVVEYLDGRGITTRYEYDPLKQIRRVVDAAGNVTLSAYDLAGRRTEATHPDSGRTEFVYDAAGNVIRRMTANLRRQGGAIEHHYDFTHLVAIRYPTFPDNNVTYTWGAASLRGQGGNRVGRIVRVDDNSGFEERQYGALGETVYERRSIDSHTMGNSPNSPEIYVTRYLYDTWGRLQQMVYPDTEVLTYAYDSGGQVHAVEGVKLGVRFPYVTRLEYDRFEQRKFQQTGNGIRTHYDYDPLDRRLATLEAGQFQRQRYDYDKVGNVKSLVNDVPNARPNEYGGRVEQSFVYDDLYRLTSATGTWSQPPGKLNQYSYTLQYDDIHNLRSKNQQHWIRNRGDGKPIPQQKTTYAWSYEYGSAKPHAATHIGDRTFFYDENGNQTGWEHERNGTRRTLVWDEENRVRSISDNGRTTRFVYDDGGDRIIKRGAQGETVYVNDKWTVRNRSVATKHVYVGASRIASKLSPGDAHVRLHEEDLVSLMLGRWWEHRSRSGHQNGRNVEKNPHYEVPSELPDDGMPETNFLYFYHPDHIGSTGYVTDVDGELYEHMQYFPSGEPWVDQRSNTERLPYLFSAKELDQETGLYYFGARYYEPRVGLWASADPASIEYLEGQLGFGGVFQPINLATYAYAAHNPQKYIDPDGRAVWIPVLAAGWVAFEIGSAIYDAYSAYETFRDPDATAVDRTVAVGGVMLSVVAPGGGYGTAGKVGKEVVEEGVEQFIKRGAREATEKVAKETGELADDVAKVGRKRGPKTDPNAPHNAKIRSEAEALIAEGHRVVAGGGKFKERLIQTHGGKRSGRRPDILYETPDGTLRGRNVGQTKADGSPVPREVDALEDLNGPGRLPTDFVPYDR